MFVYIHFKGKRLIASPKNKGGNKKKFISEGIRVLPLLVEGNTKDTKENQGGI